MFRFLSSSARVAAMATSSFRFQSSSIFGESATGSNNNRSNNSNNNNNRRIRISPQFLPRFEIHDVRDAAPQGSMTRVAVDGKQLLISQFPQLGPRKADPNDTTPQFDRERRISLRFRHMDLSGFVAVVEGHLPSHHMSNNAYELDFEKTASGYVLKGQVHRSPSQSKEEWSMRFENQFATTMEHFLQGALMESFGFAEYRRAAAEQADDTNSNDNNNRSSNNNRRNRRRNNSNNNNRKNNAEKSEVAAEPAESN